MKNNSTSADKIRKPRIDFPLFPHKTGRWAKKVRGKFVFFGSTLTDPKGEAALIFGSIKKMNSWQVASQKFIAVMALRYVICAIAFSPPSNSN